MHLRRADTIMRLALAGATGIIAVLACAGDALANSAALTVTSGGGLSDPAAGVARAFTLSGTSDRAGRVYVAFRAPGGAACAPSAASDSGRRFGSFYGSAVNGRFEFSEARTWSPAGPVVFCIWIASSESAIAVPFTQTMVFRQPVGTITAIVNPVTPQFNQQATIGVYGASEAPAKVYARIRPVGGPCAANFDEDPGRALLSGESVDGAYSLPTTTTQAVPGAYQLCLWLAMSSSDPLPIAGPQLQRLYVLAPPRPIGPQPPCVVPGVTFGIRVGTMRKRIVANNCSVGKVRYLRSRTVRRRAVVRLSSRPGSKLEAGARVTIYVSTGVTKR